MKLHLKLTSVLLSAVMCASMMMAPVSVIADETSAPEETQTTEASEKEENKETEKTPKTTEKPEPKETKPEEKKPSESKETEPEETKPSETVKETDPTESEDKKPAETEETESSKPEEIKPSEAQNEEPGEPSETDPSQTTKPEEDVPETTVTPEAGGKEDTHSVPPKNANTSVTSVSVALDAPAVGVKPDYTAEFPPDANYYSSKNNSDFYCNDICWQDVTTDNIVYTNIGKFQDGHQYKVYVYLTPKDGYCFSSNTTATLNGHKAEAVLYNDQLRVTYEFPVLEGKAIPSASITLDAPVVGAKPDYTAVFPTGINYYSDAYNSDVSLNDICWWDVTNDKAVNPHGGRFEAGHRYSVRVFLTAKGGYLFSSSTTATLNGYTAEASLFDDLLLVVYEFPTLEGEPLEGEEISSVSIVLDVPVVGGKPDYTTIIPTGAHYYSDTYNNGQLLNDIGWRDVTTNCDVNPISETFKSGHQYKVTVYLTAKDGYYFSSSTTATFNGQSVEISLYNNLLKFTYEFPVLEGEALDLISSVSITIDAPVVGAVPDYTAEFPSGVNYCSDLYNQDFVRNGIYWRDVTKNITVNPYNGKFAGVHQYQVNVYLTVKDGFRFSNTITATVNGQNAIATFDSDGLLLVSYTFSPLEKERIPSVSVTLGLLDPSVCLGSHFSYDTYFPSDANYYSNANNEGYYRNDVAWYDETTESYGNPNTGTFNGGHKYTVIVYLTPKDEYTFTNNTTATLNDRFTAEATLDGERLKVTYTFSPVQGESVDVINSVSCTIDAPVIGSNPVFNANFPVDSKYGKITNSVIWHDITTNTDINSSSLVFECGHQYQVRIDIYADAGYYFNDTTWATLNEHNAEVQKLSKSKIRISYTFPKLGSNIGDIETVDNVNYKVTNANTDGTGTVTLIGMAVKRASVSIPATVEINGFTYIVNRIGTKAFYGDKTIKTVYIGNNIAIIDANAFYGCSNLTKVSGGKVLKTIGTKAFAYCSKLKSFSIASSVLNKIGSYAFQKDKKLKTVYIKYTTKLTKSGVKKSLKKSSVKTVKVKKSKVKKYKKYFKKKNSGRSVKVKK